MRIKHSSIFASISCSFYVLTLCWFAYSFQNGAIERGLFFNADVLFFPSLFKNIILDGKHFSDWVFPPQSYLFPDVLLHAIAFLLSKNVFTQILVFAILQSILFFCLISTLLSSFIHRSNAISYSALIASNIILLGLYFPDPYGISFIEVTHFGSLLSFLILLILLIKFLSAASVKEKYSVGTLTVILAICSAISDRLILIQFVAPISLIGIYFSFARSKDKEILKFGILLIISYPLALLIGKLFLPEMGGLESGIGYGSVLNKLLMFVDWAFDKPWIIQLSIFIFPITLFTALLFLLRHRNNSDQRIVHKCLIATLILISPALMLIVTGLSDREFTSRYLLPYFLLAPVFLFILLSATPSRILVFFLCLSSCLAIAANYGKREASPQPYTSYPEFIHCIDALAQKHGVTRGIAQYWDAIPIYVFSNAGLNVVPVLDDGSPMRVEYNASEFSGEFSFAVIDNNAIGLYKISRTAIERRLSKKPFEYQCNNKTVLIFDKETITLPMQSALSDLRRSALESFVKNPRALLIMAQEESAKGNHEASERLLSEAISLLRQSGASEDTVKYYESVSEKHSLIK